MTPRVHRLLARLLVVILIATPLHAAFAAFSGVPSMPSMQAHASHQGHAMNRDAMNTSDRAMVGPQARETPLDCECCLPGPCSMPSSTCNAGHCGACVVGLTVQFRFDSIRLADARNGIVPPSPTTQPAAPLYRPPRA